MEKRVKKRQGEALTSQDFLSHHQYSIQDSDRQVVAMVDANLGAVSLRQGDTLGYSGQAGFALKHLPTEEGDEASQLLPRPHHKSWKATPHGSAARRHYRTCVPTCKRVYVHSDNSAHGHSWLNKQKCLSTYIICEQTFIHQPKNHRNGLQKDLAFLWLHS